MFFSFFLYKQTLCFRSFSLTENLRKQYKKFPIILQHIHKWFPLLLTSLLIYSLYINMVHLLKLMKNIDTSSLNKVSSLLILLLFSPDVLFLFWDPVQGATSHLVIMSCQLLVTVIVSQTFLDLDDLDSFPGQIFHRTFPN